jgi:hypothetical protein
MYNQNLKDAVMMLAIDLRPRELEIFEVLRMHDSTAAECLNDVNSCKPKREQYKDVVQVNAVVGRLGKRVLKIIGDHPDPRPDGYRTHKGYWHVLCTGYPRSPTEFVWELRPEVSDALEAVLSVYYADETE